MADATKTQHLVRWYRRSTRAITGAQTPIPPMMTIRTLRQALARHLTRNGFVKMHRSWALETAELRWVVDLDASRYGQRLRVDLGCVPIRFAALDLSANVPDEERDLAVAQIVTQLAGFIGRTATEQDLCERIRNGSFDSGFVDAELKSELLG